jgi:hypothetical protein
MRADETLASAGLDDLRGFGQLAVDAILGLAGVVEGMHHTIQRVPFIFGAPAVGPTRGITGLVYGSIRGITRLVGLGFDAAVRQLARDGGERASTAQRDALVAIVNGVVGDHLVATGNPLAVPMRLRRGGRALALEPGAIAAAIPGAGARVVVLVHGLCMNDLRWLRRGHDHGAALARDLGYAPVYLHYNTGLHVSTNGRGLADALEALVRAWPVPVEELSIVGHSMGGLVARSACHHAEAAGQAWRAKLRAMVFLGTPHQGALLARSGHWVDAALGVTPYSAPIAGLGKIRSAGITDLRHGSLLDEDWQGRDRFTLAHPRPRPVPLPAGVACCAVAASCSRHDAGPARLYGDGVVPVDSALGRHADPERALAFDESRRYLARGVGHVDLLADPGVYERIRSWLARC